MVLLMGTLTCCAPICSGMSFEALTLDRLSATDADAVGAECDAPQRALDRSDFVHVTRDLGQIDIDQKVSEALILEIAHTAGDIGVAFVVGARQRLTHLVP